MLLFGEGGGERIDTPTLTVPHPRMHERAFVLHPLAEIAPWPVDADQLAAVRGQRIERLDGWLRANGETVKGRGLRPAGVPVSNAFIANAHTRSG